ncbi:sensor histidine kinase [Actinomadura parmotrematis]|uniref:histidine kinase n=1 Tax=Actinomadura parmotrematis TaxID=2864039 RepID=A0ABS7G461_9ACTN|nr:HAMP domain-containing sensor histidine kinase [Actinomadura parmotrematis]MBW8487271.1 HAMP domain-containing histidine kinase [Actinomadura parmotrematis]
MDRPVRYLCTCLFGSVRCRVTVLTVAAAAAVLGLGLALTVTVLDRAADDRAWDKVRRTAERVVADIHGAPLPAPPPLPGPRGTREPVPAPPEPAEPRRGEADLIQVIGGNGAVLAASARLQGCPALLGPDVTEEGNALVVTEIHRSFLRYRAVVIGTHAHGTLFGDRVMVFAAEERPPQLDGWADRLTVLALLACLLALTGLWTWRVTGTTLEPVEEIRARLAHITGTSDLAERVPCDGGGAREFAGLTATVNDTLARLQAATDRERRFVSDASHDLRNPIAGLLACLENAVEEPDPDVLRAGVRTAIGDVERLDEIVNDLLVLSRLDACAPVPEERLDLAALAARELERRPAGRVPIEARLTPGALVTASPLRLARLLNNLLGNAERHAASRVVLTVRADGDGVVAEVADDGAGIAPDARERVFERFARLPESRDRDPGGTGLGLPIARQIAETYGGTLTLIGGTADLPGAHFVLRLPSAPS